MLATDVREEARDIPMPEDSAVVMDWRLRVLVGGKEDARFCSCCFNLPVGVRLEAREVPCSAHPCDLTLSRDLSRFCAILSRLCCSCCSFSFLSYASWIRRAAV